MVYKMKLSYWRMEFIDNVVRGCAKNIGFTLAIALLIIIIAALVVRALI